MFTPKDIENFNKIYNLVKTNGYTLEGAKKALTKNNNSVKKVSIPHDNEDLISKLEEIKKKLINLKSN